MPKGVYRHRKTRAVMEMIRRNFAKGHAPEVRKRAVESLRKTGARPEFRAKMTAIVTASNRDPVIYKRRVRGIRKWNREHGNSFRGGNGQPPVPKVKELAEKLEPLGFIRELPIKTKGHTTGWNAATCYKVDFGHPTRKVAVEVDGPSHRKARMQLIDRKKTEVLRALGWTVARVRH